MKTSTPISIPEAVFEAWSDELNAALQRALTYAKQRRHQYATIEHLLLSLLDEDDAVAVMKDCSADLGALRRNLTNYVDSELKDIVVDDGPVALPTAGFRRVVQRGRLQARQLSRNAVTGADFLPGIFSELLSPSARFLDAQGLTRQAVMEVIARGRIVKAGEAPN